MFGNIYIGRGKNSKRYVDEISDEGGRERGGGEIKVLRLVLFEFESFLFIKFLLIKLHLIFNFF